MWPEQVGRWGSARHAALLSQTQTRWYKRRRSGCARTRLAGPDELWNILEGHLVEARSAVLGLALGDLSAPLWGLSGARGSRPISPRPARLLAMCPG